MRNLREKWGDSEYMSNPYNYFILFFYVLCFFSNYYNYNNSYYFIEAKNALLPKCPLIKGMCNSCVLKTIFLDNR